MARPYFSDTHVRAWVDDTGDSGWAGWKIMCIACYEALLDRNTMVVEEVHDCTPEYLSTFKPVDEPCCADCGK